jgi:hypothetical protein
MDRKRSVLAASGVSAVLVACSTAVAVASGVFVAKPVDRVGTFQAIEARLVPETKLAPTSAPAGAPPRPTPLPSRSAAAPVSTGERVVGTSREFEAPSSSEPRTPPATGVPSVGPARSTSTIAHSGPSAVLTKHDDDAREPLESRGSDD